MLKKCIYSNCAVCKQVEDRDIFKLILQNMYPEVYICEHAMYKIANASGRFLIIPTLKDISRGRNGYFIIDILTALPINLNEENFEIICAKEGNCDVKEPYVAEYISK